MSPVTRSVLLDERPIVVQPSIVRATGSVTQAAVLQQIHWHAQAGHVRTHARHEWVVVKMADLGAEMGLSGDAVRRAAVRLKDAGLLVTCQPEGYDRTTWYRIDHRALSRAVGGLPNVRNRTLQAAEPHLPSGGTASTTTLLDGLDRGAAGAALPAPNVQALVAGYVEDVRAVENGHEPSRSWKQAAGAAIKRALEEGETADVVARCLGVCAKEGKNPASLAHVLSDYHAQRPRRRT